MRLSSALRRGVMILSTSTFAVSSLIATPVPAQATAGNRVLTIHYHRPAGDYAGWNLWAWGATSPDDGGASVPFTTSGGALVVDCGGVSVSFTITDPTITEFGGGLIRKSIAGNEFAAMDGGENSYLPTIPIAETGDTEVFLEQGVDAMHGPTILSGAPTNVRTVTVHYKRKLGDYSGWNVSYSGINDSDHTPFESQKDMTGSVSTPPISISNCATTTLSFIVRKSVAGNIWAAKDGPSSPSDAATLTYLLQPTGHTDIWVKQSATASVKPTVSAGYIKDVQTVSLITCSLKKGKFIALPAKSIQLRPIIWTSLTRTICTITAGKVKGVKAGTCKISGVATGTVEYTALTLKKSISVK